MATPTKPRMMPVSHMPFAAGSLRLPRKPSTTAAAGMISCMMPPTIGMNTTKKPTTPTMPAMSEMRLKTGVGLAGAAP